MYVYVCVYICMYVGMYICMHVCMCIFVRTYVCMCSFSSFNGTKYEYQQSTSVHNFSKNVGATFEILGSRRVTCSNFNVEDPQILGATVQNLDAQANWRSGFVHPWDKVYLRVLLNFMLPVFVIICISVRA
jgi:hypothetical protein